MIFGLKKEEKEALLNLVASIWTML